MMGLFSFLLRWRPKPEYSGEKIDFVVIGLGNPGEKYVSTRHNIGFRVVDEFVKTLADRRRVTFPETGLELGKVNGALAVAVAKPQTFMNRSGVSVKAIIERFKIEQERCLVVVDDFNLPLGTMRLRRNGSDGGHNGLKSIIEQVGTGFPRLRIGIGPLPPKTEVIEFVLGEFNEVEEKGLSDVQKKAINLLTSFTADKIEAVMNKFN